MGRTLDRLAKALCSPERYKQRWIEREYNGFRAQSRQCIFSSIAVFCFHNQPLNGWYFEFGSHTARTMRAAWDAFHVLYDWKYAAFDSFEGLPDLEEIDRMPIWRKGALKTSEEDFIRTVVKHGMPREKLVTVKGFYDQSLNEAVKKRFLPQRATVLYVDCDLYQSTVPVLEFAKDFFQKGTVLVFDDWFCFYGDPQRGQRRAFAEFRGRYPSLRFEQFVHTNEIQTFIYLGDATDESNRLFAGQITMAGQYKNE
jgi:O-methyltransferase